MGKKSLILILGVLIFGFTSFFSIDFVFADTNECSYQGQILENSFYCDFNLNKNPLRLEGESCLNDFECKNNKCIDGSCQVSKYSSFNETTGLLQRILQLILSRDCDPKGEYVCADSSNLSTCKFNCLDGDKNSYICGANGKWLSKGVLASNVCPDCTPGLVNCSGHTVIKKCSPSGVWENISSKVVGLCNYDCIDQGVICNKGKVSKFCNNGTWENKNQYLSGKCSFYNISSWTLKSALTNTELKQGQQRILEVGERFDFDILNTTHSIGITNIFDKLVSFELKSEPDYFTLEEGDSKKINLNGDGYYDLQLTLNNVSEDSANFTIKEINESIKKPSSGTTPPSTTPGATPASTCTPDWSCGDWSDFENSCGTRTCTDLNSCGVTTGKPITSKTCTGSRPFCGDGNCDSDIGENSERCPEDCGEKLVYPKWGIYVLIGTLVISLIAVIIIFSFRSKNKGEVLSLKSFKNNKPSSPGNPMQNGIGGRLIGNKPQQRLPIQRPLQQQKPMPAPPRKENNSGLK